MNNLRRNLFKDLFKPLQACAYHRPAAGIVMVSPHKSQEIQLKCQLDACVTAAQLINPVNYSAFLLVQSATHCFYCCDEVHCLLIDFVLQETKSLVVEDQTDG